MLGDIGQYIEIGVAPIAVILTLQFTTAIMGIAGTIGIGIIGLDNCQ